MYKDKNGKSITIIGQLIPREHDQGMFGIGIMTDEGPYYIELNRISDQLLDFLYQDIRVTGVVNRHRDGSKRIYLDDYEILE